MGEYGPIGPLIHSRALRQFHGGYEEAGITLSH